MSKAQMVANDFLNSANAAGFSVDLIGKDIVKLTKRFKPRSRADLVDCVCEYTDLLRMLPVHKNISSIWGQPDNLYRSHQALATGTFKVCMSGIKSSVITALRAAI